MTSAVVAADAALRNLLARLGAPAARADHRLRRWVDACRRLPAAGIEPVRTIHHFACTGGTLISKSIAALPNVQLLSEVDPLSDLAPAPDFTPTDMVALLRRSSRGASAEQMADLFRAQIRFVQGDAVRNGLRLVVRDHAHSHYCRGVELAERPGLRELMPPDVPLLSLVTVRHPLDSFASLTERGWVHFEPRTIDAYCRRYLAFLGAHRDVPVLRYEDFVAEPQRLVQRICDVLDLRYEARFAELQAGFAISGDSGRSGATIAARASRPRAVALEAEAARSDACVELCGLLGYGLAAGTVAA